MLGRHRTHASFSVDDLPAARRFYVDTLGFTEEFATDEVLVLRDGGGGHVLVYAKPGHRPWDSTVLGVQVDDVEAAVGELRAAGVTIERHDGVDDDGILRMDMGEVAWIRDPAGNWIALEHMAGAPAG